MYQIRIFMSAKCDLGAGAFEANTAMGQDLAFRIEERNKAMIESLKIAWGISDGS